MDDTLAHFLTDGNQSGIAGAGRPNESPAPAIDDVPAAVWTTDADLRFLTANGPAEEIFGRGAEELIGRSVVEVLAEYGSPAQPLAAYREALAGQAQSFVWVGRRRRIECRLAPRRDAAGAVIGVIGAALEIGDPIVVDGGYRMLLENSPLPMWVFDAESLRFLAVNQAAIREYGYSRDEFLAMTISELWQEPDPNWRNRIRPISDLGVASAGVWRQRRKDGSRLDVEILYTELSFGRGRAWLALAPDVTQHVAAQEALDESKRRLRSLFESPAMGVVYWGASGDMLDANDTFLRILGHTRDDLEQGRVLWRQIAPVPRPAAGPGGEPSGTVRPLIHRPYHRPDGTTITVLVAAAEWPDQGGGMAFVIDITQQIELEAQLLHWQKIEAIGRIAGGISHDCNNFLTVIVGYAEHLLRQEGISPVVRADAIEIQRAGDRAAALMQQLLAFGRKQMLAPAALSLNDVAAGMEQMLRSLAGETIDLRIVLDEAIDDVFADQGQIEQVIVNLVVNARDAMPGGGVLTLRTANTELTAQGVAPWPDCPPGRYVLLSVQDSGAGMTDEVRQRIFEPFFTTKERGHGSGLGLAIVGGIVRQCRGHLAVASQLGQGSTFTVYLPCAGRGGASQAQAALPMPLTRGRGTVLVVEDDPGVRRLIRTTLISCGYQVYVASDGREAIEYCERLTEPLRLVLTDLVMPQMSGRALGDHLRAQFPDTKVLYMTGYDDPAADCPLALRADDILLRKPFSPSTLACTVYQLLADPADRERS